MEGQRVHRQVSAPHPPPPTGPTGDHSPFPTNPDDLVARANALPFPARMRALAEHARALPEADYRSLHAALTSGDTHHREIGLHLAAARRDLPALVRALHDADLRRRALAAAIRLPVPDDALARFVLDASRQDRRAGYGVLRRSRRRALADRLLPQVFDRYGPADARDLLPACSPEVVAQWLPTVGAATGSLRRLARTAPVAVADFVAGELAALASQELRRWARANAGLVTVLAARVPEAVARLFDARYAPDLLPNSNTHVVAALLTQPEALLRARPRWLRAVTYELTTLPPRARQAVAALNATDAAALLTQVAPRTARATLLATVHIGLRRQVLEHAYPGRKLITQVTPAELALLPEGDRVELARQALAKERTVGRDWRRLELTALLPFDQARPELVAASASHRYQERGVAWRALVECAARTADPVVFADVLGEAGRAWHDQDYVRLATLRALASAPARLLASVPITVLRNAVHAAIGSADTSARSVSALTDWLVRTLRTAATRGQADRTAEVLTLVARLNTDARVGGGASIRLGRLPVEARTRLWAGMREAVLREARSGRLATALRIARLLGPDLGQLSELDTLLGEIARTATDPRDVAAAAQCWISAAGDREQRVADLVRHDPALGRLDRLWQVVATRRTDLLDAVLASPGPLPPAPASWLGRWSPAQRADYAARAARVAADDEAGLWERVAAVTAVIDPELLMALPRTAPQPVAAAALGALARTVPARRSLPVLVEQATTPAGPVARAAVRALRTALDTLPDNQVADLLGPVLLGRSGSVGAAREAARLLADARPTGAVDLLTAAWAQPDAHRDVRAAVAGALVGFLDQPGVAALVAEAVRGPAAVRAAVLATMPDRLAPRLRPALARALAEALTSDDSAVLAEVVTAYGTWWQYHAAGVDQVGHLVAAASTWEVFHAALPVLVAAIGTERGRSALASAVNQLVTAANSAGEAAATTAWQRLADLAGVMSRHQFIDLEPADHTAVRRLLIEACQAVGMVAESVRLVKDLAWRSLSGPPDLALWSELVATVADRPHRWDRYGGGIVLGDGEPDPDTVLAVLDHLRGLTGSVPGLLAVQLLTSVGHRAGWASPWRERLTHWRTHPDPDVREAARSVSTVPGRPRYGW